MTLILLMAFLAVVAVPCLYVIIHAIVWLWQLQSIEILPWEKNDDEKAISLVISLVDEAEEQIELYDDGNKIESSLYDDGRFIDAIKDKLEKNKDFRVQCMFNYDEDLQFKEAFKNDARVLIYVRQGQERPQDTHYKIIDDGRKAYLSQHVAGADRRAYRMVDCSRVNKAQLKKIDRFLFGDYRQGLSEFKRLALATSPDGSSA